MENQSHRGNRKSVVEKKKYGVHVLVREYAKSYRTLALVEIPDQYRKVGEEAFRDSRALEKVVFPKRTKVFALFSRQKKTRQKCLPGMQLFYVTPPFKWWLCLLLFLFSSVFSFFFCALSFSSFCFLISKERQSCRVSFSAAILTLHKKMSATVKPNAAGLPAIGNTAALFHIQK